MLVLARETGDSIKPRASAPCVSAGSASQKSFQAIEDSDSRLILSGCRPLSRACAFIAYPNPALTRGAAKRGAATRSRGLNQEIA